LIGIIRQRVNRGLGQRRIPVVGHHHREEAALARGAGLGDVLVVGREGLGPVHHLAEHEEAEEALREDQLLLHPLDVQVRQPRLHVGEARRALQRRAERRGKRRRRHRLTVHAELVAAVAELHPRRLVLQVIREAVHPAVALQHMAVGRDDDRALGPGTRRRLRQALRRKGDPDHLGDLEHEGVVRHASLLPSSHIS
jgi:hypothetical protein